MFDAPQVLVQVGCLGLARPIVKQPICSHQLVPLHELGLADPDELQGHPQGDGDHCVVEDKVGEEIAEAIDRDGELVMTKVIG